MRAVLVISFIAALAGPASAHMVVLPSQSEAGGWERYSLLVPTEKDAATVRIQLTLPLGLKIVAIEAKPGWQGAHDPLPIGAATLRWNGGRIPPGEMLSFEFLAWNPPRATTLTWEGTQWYEDGTKDRWGMPGDRGHDASTTTLVAGGTRSQGGIEHLDEPTGSAGRHAEGGAAPAGRTVPGEGAQSTGPLHDERNADGRAVADGGRIGMVTTQAPSSGAGPSVALSVALSSLALSVAALAVAANARRRAGGA